MQDGFVLVVVVDEDLSNWMSRQINGLNDGRDVLIVKKIEDEPPVVLCCWKIYYKHCKARFLLPFICSYEATSYLSPFVILWLDTFFWGHELRAV